MNLASKRGSHPTFRVYCRITRLHEVLRRVREVRVAGRALWTGVGPGCGKLVKQHRKYDRSQDLKQL